MHNAEVEKRDLEIEADEPALSEDEKSKPPTRSRKKTSV
jgi:hypothetical protein